MLRLTTTLKAHVVHLEDRLRSRAGAKDEGAGATEYILITLGGLILVGIVFAALRAFATAQAGNLDSPL